MATDYIGFRNAMSRVGSKSQGRKRARQFPTLAFKYYILRNRFFGGFFFIFVCMDVKNLYQSFLKSSGVCTDTRKIKENWIFFSLKGDNFNGNHYAEEALEKGAMVAVIDDEAYHKLPRQMVLVNDSLSALQALAHHHRKQLKTPIIALTGSNGKTTTKELIHAVLSEKYKTKATLGNLNNHIGVPLTLLEIGRASCRERVEIQ